MSGRGRAFDNILVERLWRSYKYEEVYLNPESVSAKCLDCRFGLVSRVWFS
jgi:putative transposase